ncbi:hypothetical protein P3T76_005897 [Phytophthora citrophthora]|uniref:DUF6818 domain-containing protein n=1 Tax=Phytophthora citrophthora TaxID=4793 RepID=A0AAD9LMB7_9STRA|nr:hypothetical protein P3T76_005897 [Phytophthora citrophthora]
MNYSFPEVMHMLATTQKILPQGKDMWESVAARYNATCAERWPDRDMESLRRKFKGLYGTRKLTSNRNIPTHVRLAKEVKKLIDEASSVFLASDDEDKVVQQHLMPYVVVLLSTNPALPMRLEATASFSEKAKVDSTLALNTL